MHHAYRVHKVLDGSNWPAFSVPAAQRRGSYLRDELPPPEIANGLLLGRCSQPV
jgi:hypothetical protein